MVAVSNNRLPEKSTNVRSRNQPPELLRVSMRALGTISPPLALKVAESMFFTPPRRPESEKGRGFLRHGTRFEVELRGQKLPAWRFGEGEPVLFVHGWAGRASQARRLAKAMIDAGLMPIVFDAPAHGQAAGDRTNIYEIADAIHAVAARFGRLRAVVAHSLGANAATRAMRTGLDVERAVFIAPLARPRRYFARFLLELGLGQDGRDYAEWALPRRLGIAWEEIDLPSVVGTIQAPLLLFHDRGDIEIPFEEGEAIAAAWPNAELVATEGLGHHRLLADAGVIARALEFVSRPGERAAYRAAHACANPGCANLADPECEGGMCQTCTVERSLFDRRLR